MRESGNADLRKLEWVLLAIEREREREREELEVCNNGVCCFTAIRL